MSESFHADQRVQSGESDPRETVKCADNVVRLGPRAGVHHRQRAKRRRGRQRLVPARVGQVAMDKMVVLLQDTRWSHRRGGNRALTFHSRFSCRRALYNLYDRGAHWVSHMGSPFLM